MPTETPNRPSRIGLEKCFPEREWPKTHIPLVTEPGPGRRRWTAPPRMGDGSSLAPEYATMFQAQLEVFYFIRCARSSMRKACRRLRS